MPSCCAHSPAYMKSSTLRLHDVLSAVAASWTSLTVPPPRLPHRYDLTNMTAARGQRLALLQHRAQQQGLHVPHGFVRSADAQLEDCLPGTAPLGEQGQGSGVVRWRFKLYSGQECDGAEVLQQLQQLYTRELSAVWSCASHLAAVVGCCHGDLSSTCRVGSVQTTCGVLLHASCTLQAGLAAAC